ncbi:hypothetical protein P9112_008259 [Eukaryota sp. TZLM1-RC]
MSDHYTLLLSMLERSFLIVLLTFLALFLYLLLESLLRRHFDSPPLSIPRIKSTRTIILRCFRTAFLSSLLLSVPLIFGSIRRSFTDASSFNMKQSLYHALFSLFSIKAILVINKYVAGNCLHEILWPRSVLGWISLSGDDSPRPIRRKGHCFSIKFITVFLITIGTHALTPLLFAIVNCYYDFTCSAYSSGGFLHSTAFFFVQQLWLLVNAIFEETAWRGVVLAIFEKEKKGSFMGHSTFSMYFTSGLLYALCHSLNSNFDDVGVYVIMTVNLTVEGVVWMYLLRSSDDLVLNWILHHVDDLLSIWFGTASLASYQLSEGQICTWAIKSTCQRVINGGDFGTGGSLLYFGQNFWTFLVILVLRNSYFKYKPKGFLKDLQGSINFNSPGSPFLVDQK